MRTDKAAADIADGTWNSKSEVNNSTEEELAQTVFSQPAIMATSLVAFEIMKKNGVDLGCVPIGMQALAEAVCRLK